MKRKGISEIVSTIIIVSAMLLISIAVMFVANDMFNYQTENVEFEQAKNVMINLASIIEGVSGKEGASGYVRFNPISGGPNFMRNVGSITIRVSSHNVTSTIDSAVLLSNHPYNIFEYRCGSLVGIGGREIYRGVPTGSERINNIILNNENPLGAVYAVQENGVWIILNFSRVNVINMGVFNFSKGIINDTVVFEPMNLIEIHYIDLLPGSFSGSGSVFVVAKTQKVSVSYHLLNSTSSSDVYITVDVNGEKANVTVDNQYNTVVIFVVSRVEISMFGG